MIATAYELPFVFRVPLANPWDGQHVVDVSIQPVGGPDTTAAKNIAAAMEQFRWLGAAGALAGEHVTSAKSSLGQPMIATHLGSVVYRFDPAHLDERASNVLLSLMLAAHVDLPIRALVVSSAGIASAAVAQDERLEAPYPGLVLRPGFALEIEDSESDTRVLRLQFVQPSDETRLAILCTELTSWARAINAGAFGLAPLSPRECDCLPEEIECDEHELVWPLYKCRFHPDALNSLINLCSTLHARLLPMRECAIE
jgi:hypothetical protein